MSSPLLLNSVRMSALYPIANQIAQAMRLSSDATSDTKLNRLEALASQTGLPIEESVALFAVMLSIPIVETESCFREALNVTREQQSKSLELRAAMSLARLWQTQMRRQEAHDLLAPVYEWFTEGFDTADLQEAKDILSNLAD